MEIFKFEKDDLTRYIEHKLRTVQKFREPFNYIVKTLENRKHSMVIESLDKSIDLNKVKQHKGKNYNWSTFSYKNVTLLIRVYQKHLTIFTKIFVDGKYPKTNYGAFTFYVELDKLNLTDDEQDGLSEVYYENPFTGLNKIIKNLFEVLIDRGVHWVSNSACLKVDKEVEIKVAFDEHSIHSLDRFVFCMEEIDTLYLEFFAETTMLKKLEEFKTGDKLSERYKVGRVSTKVEKNYYYTAGIELIDTMQEDKKEFQDVYTLTRYHFKDVFKDNICIFKGEIYTQGGDFEVGKPVAYKRTFDGDDEQVTLFEDTFPKENFIPLVKF